VDSDRWAWCFFAVGRDGKKKKGSGTCRIQHGGNKQHVKPSENEVACEVEAAAALATAWLLSFREHTRFGNHNSKQDNTADSNEIPYYVLKVHQCYF
jgi:hypothetical protein